MSDEIKEKDMDLLRQAGLKLGEHFDSIQIFATRYESHEEGTTSAKWGTGNWFSRYGQVKEWMIRQDEDARIDERKGEKE